MKIQLGARQYVFDMFATPQGSQPLNDFDADERLMLQQMLNHGIERLQQDGATNVRGVLARVNELPKEFRDVLPIGTYLARETLWWHVVFEHTEDFDLDWEENAAAGSWLRTEDWAKILEQTFLALGVKQCIQDLLLTVALAYPGKLGLSGGGIVFEQRLLDKLREQKRFALLWARQAATENGWPAITDISLIDVLAWLKKQPGFESGFGGGRTGRALNALSHVLYTTDEAAVQLMWAMVGIEALFTNGTTGLAQQVRDRAFAFLGSPQRDSKIITRMYDLRSRFVHGDLDFAGAHHWMPDYPGAAEAFRDLHHARTTAVAVLVASLQELIRRDWDALAFSTSCAPA